jgi:DNA-binding transcriptional ArsR family regulator
MSVKRATDDNEKKLNLVFHALADPTRREMVRLVAVQERSVSELAAPFDISLAGVSKHIKVLEGAGIFYRTIIGRTHTCRLNPSSMTVASKWLKFYERLRDMQFDALERALEQEDE